MFYFFLRLTDISDVTMLSIAVVGVFVDRCKANLGIFEVTIENSTKIGDALLTDFFRFFGTLSEVY